MAKTVEGRCHHTALAETIERPPRVFGGGLPAAALGGGGEIAERHRVGVVGDAAESFDDRAIECKGAAGERHQRRRGGVVVGEAGVAERGAAGVVTHRGEP